MVAQANLGAPVRCPQCKQSFTLGPSAKPVRSGPPRLDIGSATSPGRQRERNEDSFVVQHLVWSNLDERHELALLVVADGMGGHEAGDRASGILVRAVARAMAPLLAGALDGKFKDAGAAELADTLDFGLQEANRTVFRKSKGDPACKGMGATAVAMLVWDDRVLISHVGDCRVYHQRAGRLTQVTRDQTLVARMVELGQLTPQEAEKHPLRNEVSQAVGIRADLTPARHDLQLTVGDWLVTACDGLHAHVSAATLQARLAGCTSAAAQMAQQLVDLANQGGGSDNCTVVAVRCV
jgi:protein phosphatase